MVNDTINNDKTMGGANGALLAGRYRIVRQLGHGGMGSVWLAEDTKLDGFKVAIKMLPSILVNNKRAYAQVKAEALVSLKLSHPNIATVRAFEEESGSPFLVMDYIDGQTLDDYLAEKGKLTEEETVKLLKPVAAALDYAHTQGVVHRDVKPGNVMIRKDATPFVLDFGIAREIQETMTRVTGKLSSGTLMYMSPEQLNGASPKPAQDIYSFAAMAYECLKGEPPFSRGQVEWQILNREPEPFVDGAMATFVMQGLAKDSAQRPATCLGVLAAARPCARSSFDFRAAVVKNQWLAFVLVAVLAGAVFMIVNRKAPRRSASAPAVAEAQAEEMVDRNELDRTRIEAQVKVAACRRLDKGDGFGAKIEECENGLVRAKAEYDLKRWGDALRDYGKVLGQSSGLVALDADRLCARAAAEKMGRLARAAKDAAAERYAAVRFNAAKDLIVEAKKAFAEMRFAEAADKHEFAARQFELSVGEAKTEAVRRKNWRQEGKEFTITDSGLAMTMKWCPAGSFDMGSPESEEGREACEKQHHVTLSKGFWMGETEVTQGQWKKLMGGETIVDLARKELEDDIPVKVNGTWQFVRDYLGVGNFNDPQNICGDIDDDVPVYYVNWDEAMMFCRKLTERERAAGRVPDGYEYRLPTEAEWEYACRATTTTALPNGQPFHAAGLNNASALDDIAWYGGNASVGFVGRGWDTKGLKEKQYPGGRAAPRKVKGKSPNKWGLFDMTGNVCEWCSDITSDYRDSETDPLGALKGTYRSFRGGTWWSSAVWCRSSSRCWFDANYRHHQLGLRVALAPQYADYPYEVQQLTGRDLTSAVEEARKYHDSLQQKEEQKKSRENARAAAEFARRLAETADAVRYANAEWNTAQASFDKASSMSDKDAVPEYATAEGLFRQAKEIAEQNAKPTVPLYDRPDNMNFCRHCRTPLTSYSKVPQNCPKCGKNLFGN